MLTGAEGFTSEEDQDVLTRVEKQLKRRFAIGSQVSEHNIVQDFLKQVQNHLRLLLFVRCVERGVEAYG